MAAAEKSDLSGFAPAVRAHPVAPDLIRGPPLTDRARRSRSKRDRTVCAGREGRGWTPDRVRGDGICLSSSPCHTKDAHFNSFTRSTAGLRVIPAALLALFLGACSGVDRPGVPATGAEKQEARRLLQASALPRQRQLDEAAQYALRSTGSSGTSARRRTGSVCA